ncbi:imidazole glycerol phosphate synthase subunit HisH [Ileibacterium valens]|uniref:imidazole glycerol phosphate synthase subunit HisH n=1 Tax=Ileibacterium valens TaxID=1862668 RepID=UPI0023565BCC|nr:imidazole glycerol phosphate synthase subunit HisH [Ileibacterium valens]
MIGIIDYGMGNLHSVQNACTHLGLESLISENPEQLRKCDKLILPGVGAFGDLMKNLKKTGLDQFVLDEVGKNKKPILGICLGMQALFESSEENGHQLGLGFLKGEVIPMKGYDIRIPEIGWNDLVIRSSHPLKDKLSANPFAYYDHSYFASGFDPDDLIAYSQYGPYLVPGIVGRDNVVGTQFHPEKSGKDGLKILEWFAKEFNNDHSSSN